jgi:transcriptional regulator with XRE-family HTH domain
MATAATLIRAIKQHLQQQGITYRELARRLKVSEPTVKRDLARGDFTLSRLDGICHVLGVTIEDLANTQPVRQTLLTQLTVQQEHALVSNPKLLLVTYLIVNQWTREEIVRTFQIEESDFISLLLTLDKLGIVEFRAPRRVRPLTARNFSWRKDGPVHEFFLRRVAPEYLRARFDGQGDEFHFVGGTLTRPSLTRFKSVLNKVVAEFEELARTDAKLPLEERDGCTAMLTVRKWEFSEFTRLRRVRGEPKRRS